MLDRQTDVKAGKRFAVQGDSRQGNKQVRGLPDSQTDVKVTGR